jgi:hypothetical protein
MMKRWISLVLLPALAACYAIARPQVTWMETELIASEPAIYGKIFLFKWDRAIGACNVDGGSHVSLHRNGAGPHPTFTTGIGLFTTADEGARLQYGITMLAADGTTLAHFPSNNGAREYVAHIPANVRIIDGPSARLSTDVYERAARILVHARCFSGGQWSGTPGAPTGTPAPGLGQRPRG